MTGKSAQERARKLLEGVVGNGLPARDLAKPARGILERAGIAFGEEQHVGDPGSLLAQRAKKGRYDLVVMGSHGHGAWKSLVLGSVTSKVMSGCEVPVLVVR